MNALRSQIHEQNKREREKKPWKMNVQLMFCLAKSDTLTKQTVFRIGELQANLLLYSQLFEDFYYFLNSFSFLHSSCLFALAIFSSLHFVFMIFSCVFESLCLKCTEFNRNHVVIICVTWKMYKCSVHILYWTLKW